MVSDDHHQQLKHTGDEEREDRVGKGLAQTVRPFGLLRKIGLLHDGEGLDRARAFDLAFLERRKRRALPGGHDVWSQTQSQAREIWQGADR